MTGNERIILLQFISSIIINNEQQLEAHQDYIVHMYKELKKIDTSFTIHGEFINGILFEVKSSCKTNFKKPILKISSETDKNLYLFNNYKNLKINRRIVKFNKIKFADKFYSNPWRESQYFYLKDLKKILNDANLTKNLLKMSFKNLKLIF